MMLKPSIDNLMDEVNSKYSLVILASKRSHELRSGCVPTLSNFKSVTPVQQALEEIEAGRVVIHKDPEGKREKIRQQKAEVMRAIQEETEKIERQIQAEGNL